ncbi:MAG: enoyl-CoA hydratase/isomerase family protein [Nocardioides sp.]|nr:enoyl-CoA hydratase/isomerase family protein [Nocardioides sp.]
MTPDDIAAAGLLVEVTGPLATLTLHRPEVRNAQTPTMWRALAQVGADLGPEVRVVVVRGSGAGFSAGLDRRLLDPASASGGPESVIDMFAMSETDMTATIEAYQRGFTFLRDPQWVSVAVVHGHAVGAGFQLALSCDLRLAAPDAAFCMKESALGMVPDLTGTQPLVAAVGYARALEICATSRTVGAEEALRIGLVQEVAPAGQLDQRLHALVAGLLGPLPGAVRETKALLQGALERSLEDQRRLEREAQVRRFRELAALVPSAGVVAPVRSGT